MSKFEILNQDCVVLQASICVMVVFVVALFLIPQPLCCFWLVVSIFSIILGVFGFMSWWGVSMDSIASITSIMCIGFCVDFTMHVTSAFVLEGGQSRMERVRRSLYLVGTPVLQGVAVILVGVASITTPESYFFRAVFRIVFLFTVIAAVHTLLFVPVALLSYGPATFDKHSVFRIQSRNALLGLTGDLCELPEEASGSSSGSGLAVASLTAKVSPMHVVELKRRLTGSYVTPVRAHLPLLEKALREEANLRSGESSFLDVN